MAKKSRSSGIFFLASLLLQDAVAADVVMAEEEPLTCVAPGICKAPDTKFSRVITGPKPGLQWNINGGFCGSFSTQQSALAKGAYLSQDKVRKANRLGPDEPHGEHGNTDLGWEVMPANVAFTAKKLGLKYEEFDYTQPKPQAEAFKKFLKRNLAQGHPIVWFPMCKGDDHECYEGKSCPNGGHVDHVEPMFGIFSNHELNDTTVYEDDWILHASDQDLMPYYRTLNSLPDSTKMDGNCKNAQPGFGKNEMYPCVDEEVSYGLAVKGLDIEGAHTVALTIPITREPDVRMIQSPIEITGTVVVENLKPKTSYVLLRYDNPQALPKQPPFDDYTAVVPFETCKMGRWSYEDPKPFLSNSTVYYFAADFSDVSGLEDDSIVV